MKNKIIKYMVSLSILLTLGLLIASYLIFFRSNAALDCDSNSLDECPTECVICPPCEYCSSISCQTEEFCASMGFDKEWYGTYVVK